MKLLSLLTLLTLNFAMATTYQSLPSSQKQDFLWEKIQDTEFTSGLPDSSGSFVEILRGVSKHFLAKTMTHESDFMPDGRPKIIHAQGSSAKVVLKINADSPYSGLLSSGEYLGLIRLSTATAPSKSSFIPGFALKIFRESMASANLVAMNRLSGQGANHNFFALPFSTKIPEPNNPVLKFGAYLFQRAINMVNRGEKPTELPMEHFTSYTSEGQKIATADMSTPRFLTFEPMVSMPESQQPDFRVKLENYPAGTVLYKVHAVPYKGNPVEIGEIVLTSEFIASQFGDENLFFQHNIMRSF